MVETKEWKSQAQTPTGGRSSSMKESTSSTSKMEKHLMSQEEKMKKDNLLSFGVSMVETTRDGKSSILTKLERLLIKVLTKNSDSMSIDHSILYPDSH